MAFQTSVRGWSRGRPTTAATTAMLLFVISLAILARQASGAGDYWLRLPPNVSCKDPTLETVRDVRSQAACEGKCAARRDCTSYSYYGKRTSCYLKASCWAQLLGGTDLSGFRITPGTPSEEMYMLWTWRQSLSAYNRDCGVASWSLAVNHCKWAGVECSSQGRVVSLSLDSCGLQGSLPTNLTLLPKLSTLSLRINKLNGRLPKEWSGHQSLKTIYLDNNSLSGWLPFSWALPAATHIFLSDNQLAGTLPPAWASGLPKLEELELQGNGLIGPLPPAWADFQQIYRLDLSNNHLTGVLPVEWSSIGVTRLFLSGNHFNGTLPVDWHFINPMVLSLSSNELTGPLPLEWSSMYDLEDLAMCGNKLTGTVPAEWYVGMRYLEDDCFDSAQDVPKGIISAEQNALMDFKGRRSFSADCNLKDWVVGPNTEWDSHCFWGGVECDGAQRIIEIKLPGCGLDGNLPDSLSILTTLRNLNLENNRLTGPLPKSYSTMTKFLRSLTLENNTLAGPLPACYSRMAGLTGLHLAGNALCGPIPPAWSTLFRLSKVDLSRNALTSTLPASWAFTLNELSNLKLDRNFLTGTLPMEWANMAKLDELRIASNRLAGPLPPIYSRLSELRALDLSGNELTGPLPIHWTSIEWMKDLNLCNNRLSKTVPKEWKTWPTRGDNTTCLSSQRTQPLQRQPAPPCAKDEAAPAPARAAKYSGWVGEVVANGEQIPDFEVACKLGGGEVCEDFCEQACSAHPECNAFNLDVDRCTFYRDAYSVWNENCDDCTVSLCIEDCPAGTTPFYYTISHDVCTNAPMKIVKLESAEPRAAHAECYWACKAKTGCTVFAIDKDDPQDCKLYSTCEDDYDYDEYDMTGHFRLEEQHGGSSAF